ncbi:DUF2755 family protein [Escherichia coli]
MLFCFWAGAQLLNLLVHAPSVSQRLMQVQETGQPTGGNWFRCRHHFRADPLVGCLIFAVVALWLHWRHHHQ